MSVCFPEHRNMITYFSIEPNTNWTMRMYAVLFFIRFYLSRLSNKERILNSLETYIPIKANHFDIALQRQINEVDFLPNYSMV